MSICFFIFGGGARADEHVCVAAENVLGSAVLEQRLGSASKAAPGQSKHTGSYSWPNQIDVRFCPSSAPHFHMNAEYAKVKKKEKKREIYKILSHGAAAGRTDLQGDVYMLLHCR